MRDDYDSPWKDVIDSFCGDYAIVLIHVEVQAQRDKEFPERMFI